MLSSPSGFWQALDAFLTRIRPRRQPLSLLVDAAVVALAWQATYLFRLGFERWIEARPAYDGWVLLGIVVVYVAVFALLGVPKGMWRFSGFGEIQRLMLACALAGALSAAAVKMAHLHGVPRAVLALHPLVALFGVCGVRMLYRTLYEHLRLTISGRAGETRRALVLGAGDAARRLLAGIQHEGWTVVGLLDDDPAKRDGRVAGVPVLGPLAELPQHAKTQGITHVIVAIPSAKPAVRRQVLEMAVQGGLPVLTVPNARELQDGSVQRLRDIQPEDLLGRAPVELDERQIAQTLAGKVVLVTGAGGSIGSELCRQLARFRPQRMILLELSEFALYEIDRELGEKWPQTSRVPLMGDVKDLEHLRHLFRQWKPQVVFHAAAYKHVPLVEEGNAWTALRNNTLGTYHVALAAGEAAAEHFVLISTDKAVNPTNVMGATKRAAEMTLSALVTDHPATKYMAVRFGNVLGSSGSVIPKFKEQIAKGGPITVTHPEVIRYFMTIPEAARLVLQAAAVGDSGQVLVLNMGEPVKIVDLATDLIRLAGLTPEDIPVRFTGLRAGEKLFEELLANGDDALPTAVEGVQIARMTTVCANEVMALLAWAAAGLNGGAEPRHLDAAVRLRLQKAVPEYQPRAPSSDDRRSQTNGY